MSLAMTHRASSAGSSWDQVDRSADPGAFVGYLDAVSADASVRAYKQQTYVLLRLRPGDHVLDVGCGTGDDARALARTVTPGGRIIAVDASVAMVEEARRRSDGDVAPLEFRVGDAHGLDFPDGAFDGVRADRVFQHLADPEQALAELVRVTKLGGRIVVSDPDWDTLTLDGADRETTRVVLAEIGAAATRHPWMGRRLFGMFRRAGLAEVTASTGTGAFFDYAQADRLFHIADAVNRMVTSGAITEAAATDWMGQIQEAAAAGHFFSSLTAFIVAGSRP